MTAREGLKLIAIALFLTQIWSIVVSIAANPYLEIDEVYDPTELGWMAIPIVIASVVIEEAMRLLPLALVVRFAGRNAPLVLGTAVVTAALFGAAHVPNGLPLWFVLSCQGVTGFVMNLLYLKAGGLHGQVVRGFFFALAFHIAFDMVLLVPALLLMQR